MMRDRESKFVERALNKALRECNFLSVTGLSGFGAGGARPLKRTYLTTVADTTSKSTYTFSGVSLGSGSFIVVVSYSHGANDCTAITLGGVAPLYSSAMTAYSTIFSIFKHPGTASGVLVLTYAAATNENCTASVYSLAGDLVSITPTIVDDSTSPYSVTASITGGGVLFGFARNNNDSSLSFTAGVTQDYNAVIDTRTRLAVGSANIAETDTSYTVSSNTNQYLTSCYWR